MRCNRVKELSATWSKVERVGRRANGKITRREAPTPRKSRQGRQRLTSLSTKLSPFDMRRSTVDPVPYQLAYLQTEVHTMEERERDVSGCVQRGERMDRLTKLARSSMRGSSSS